MQFRAEIEATSKTSAGIRVPPEVLAALGPSRRPAVRVTIGTHTYRSTVGTVDGAPMLPVSVENRKAAFVVPGDEVEVKLVLDSAPREVNLPADFARALGHEPVARARFEALSYSRRRWFVMGIEGARTAATRVRRIDKAVTLLREDAT
jgi:hypothetical protein